MKKLRALLLALLLLLPFPVYATFIEATLGTAVVNDATATFHNPSALTLLKNPQLIGLGTTAYFHSHFTGQSTQVATGFTQTGSTSANTHYFLPALYIASPINNQIYIGIAVVSNYFNRDADNTSVLRYVQSSNNIQDLDIIPAVGIKLNEKFSAGFGIAYSYANFVLQPTIGFPSLNIPDSQSREASDGTGIGGDVGFLFRPNQATTIGFNYRSSITYQLSGRSIFQGPPMVISNRYHLKFWTPAQSVLSINQFLTPKWGWIGTAQFIQTSILKKVHAHNIAAVINGQPTIVNANIPFHLQDSWLFTLGSYYRILPPWVVRIAGTFVQAPGNNNYQISTGNSYILGASTGYEINKYIAVDASYSHAFIRNQNINITGGPNIVNGLNTASRDAVSLKLTLNA